MSLAIGRRLPVHRPAWLAPVAWTVAVLALGVATAMPDPWVLVLGTAGVLTVVFTFIQPLVALPLLLFAVPFGGLARQAPDPAASSELSVGAAEILVALLVAAWLTRGIAYGRITVPLGTVALALLALIGLAAISIGYADNKSLAFKETLKWLELGMVMVILLDLVSTQRAALWIMGAMFMAGAAEAAYGAFQFATGAGPDAFAVQGALRAFGHFEQPNPFAGYLTTITPLAVMMTLTPANPARFRWFAAAATLMIAVGIALSQSRGAWLGATIAAGVLVLTWSRTTRKLVVPGAVLGTLGIVAAVSGLLPPAVLDRVAQAIEYFGVFDVRNVQVTPENWAVVERMAHWQAGWYMFLDHPWIGVGAGNYSEAYPAYFVGPWPEALWHAHNFYLNMLAELGVFGGALLVLVLGLAFHVLGGTLLRSEDQQHTFWRALLAGCIGGLVVFSVHNMFDSLFVHSVNVQMGALLGLGLVAVRRLTPAT